MIIVGIDASTNRTGYAVIKDDNILEHGVFDLHKNKDTTSRLEEMCSKVLSILSEYHPHVVYIEDAWQGNNPKTMKLLMHIIGSVYGWCVSNHIKCVEIIPSSWRKTIGWDIGKKSRDELKIMSLKYVNDTYGIITTSDDLADAICIATAGKILERGK